MNANLTRTVNNGSNEMHEAVKLPSINIPDFHGSYTQWMSFYYLFCSLVHNNDQLSNVQKFCYLRACLKSEAAQLIQSIEITNDNYEVAWGILEERYKNKKLIVHTHVKALFDSPQIKGECYKELRKLLDNVNKNLRVLQALGQEIDKWDTPLIYLVTSKLDPTTKREWEESKNETEMPKLSELKDFLAKRCNLLEILDNKNKTLRFVSERVLTHVSAWKQKIRCTFCNENHLNFQCDKILNMPRENLYDLIKNTSFAFIV